MIIHEAIDRQQEISLTPARQKMIFMLNFDYMKKLILPLLLLLALTCPTFAEDDEINAVPDDTAAVEQEQQPAAPVTAMPSNITATPEFKAVQTKVMNSPDVLSDIQKLMQDPEVMAIISDPEFIAAIQSGSPTAIGSNPRLKVLSENPKVQALIQKIKSQQ